VRTRLIRDVGKMRMFTRIGIRILPVVTSAHPHIRIIPPAVTCYRPKGNKVVEIRNHVTRHVETFSLRMCTNGYLGVFSQKSDAAIRSHYLDVL